MSIAMSRKEQLPRSRVISTGDCLPIRQTVSWARGHYLTPFHATPCPLPPAMTSAPDTVTLAQRKGLVSAFHWIELNSIVGDKDLSCPKWEGRSQTKRRLGKDHQPIRRDTAHFLEARQCLNLTLLLLVPGEVQGS